MGKKEITSKKNRVENHNCHTKNFAELPWYMYEIHFISIRHLKGHHNKAYGDTGVTPSIEKVGELFHFLKISEIKKYKPEESNKIQS